MAWYKSEIRLVSAKARAEVRNPKSETVSDLALRASDFLLFVCVIFSPIVVHAFSIPPNDGFVTDTVGILSESQQQRLESDLHAYREETSNEIAVFIVESVGGEPIADVSVEIGRAWGVGSKEFNNGVLILMAYADREVFIATGYGLEGAVPDIVAKGIIDRDMTPSFRDGDYADGLEAGIEALKKHISGEYAPERYATPGGGAWVSPFIAALIVCSLFFIVVFIFWVHTKTPSSRRRRGGGWWIGGGGGGGRGGFGGGTFGGGGAGGRW